MNWLAWWNLIFVLPGIAGVLSLGLVFVGVADDDAGEVDLDGDADLDGEVIPGDAVGVWLGLAGIGQIPLPLWLGIFGLAYGLIGLTVNLCTAPVLVAVFCALAGGLAVAALFARLFRRLVPREETAAEPPEALAGQTGRMIDLVSEVEGYAQVRDRFGNLQQVRCRSHASTPLARNQPIIVVSVDPSTRLCLVVPDETV